jgi:hypothetical protein
MRFYPGKPSQNAPACPPLHLACQPFGHQFLFWSMRYRIALDSGLMPPGDLLERGFAKIGWPDGLVTLDELILAIGKAWPDKFEVRALQCQCLTRDEVTMLRLTALMALGLPEIVQDDLESFLPTCRADSVLQALADHMHGLLAAGLGFGLTTLPALPGALTA